MIQAKCFSVWAIEGSGSRRQWRNRNDTGKRVHVEFTALEGGSQPGIAIRVRDEGGGFDPSVLGDPRTPENIMKTSGRGIFLMRSFMDEMTFQRAAEGGMEVRMVKRIDKLSVA